MRFPTGVSTSSAFADADTTPLPRDHYIRSTGVAALRFVRDGAWAKPERLRGYLILLALAHVVGLVALIYLASNGVDARGEPLGSDFVSFWTAGSMAIGGRVAGVYTPDAHHAAEVALFGHPLGWYAFFYPPIFILACVPLGLFGYLPALVIWLSATFVGFAAALRGLSARFVNPLTLIAFPGVFSTVGHGQNAFLTTALFAGGAALVERRPIVAGALLGALCFKPQLAVLVPLGLLLAGRWRALGAMTASVALLAALSVCAFGLETWRAFVSESHLTQFTLEHSLVDPAKMQSVFAAVRVLGGGSGLAYAAQGLAAVAALGGLVYALRRERSGRRQFALIAAATCLTTPFLLDYDLTLLLAPIAILADEGLAEGFLTYEQSVLAAAYLLPAFARPLAHYAHLPLSPLVVASLGVVLIRRTVARNCEPGAVKA